MLMRWNRAASRACPAVTSSTTSAPLPARRGTRVARPRTRRTARIAAPAVRPDAARWVLPEPAGPLSSTTARPVRPALDQRSAASFDGPPGNPRARSVGVAAASSGKLLAAAARIAAGGPLRRPASLCRVSRAGSPVAAQREAHQHADRRRRAARRAARRRSRTASRRRRARTSATPDAAPMRVADERGCRMLPSMNWPTAKIAERRPATQIQSGQNCTSATPTASTKPTIEPTKGMKLMSPGHDADQESRSSARPATARWRRTARG